MLKVLRTVRNDKLQLTSFLENAILRIMSILRVLLIPILTVCMLTQPFCGHCFAQMRTMTECAGSLEQKTPAIDAGSFPVQSKGVCTKKPCLSSPKIEIDRLQITTCAWHGYFHAEAFPSCSVSVDADILFGDDARCPAWLRFSVLLI